MYIIMKKSNLAGWYSYHCYNGFIQAYKEYKELTKEYSLYEFRITKD